MTGSRHRHKVRPSPYLYHPFQSAINRNSIGGEILNQIAQSLSTFFNPLPNKIFDVTKLKVFADNKLNFAKMTISLFNRVENTVRKGENADNQYFLLFP